MTDSPRMQVQLVEDEPEDLQQYMRDFPAVFESRNVDVDLHACDNFDDAISLSSNPLHRYDLIVSDTYRGKPSDGDAAVLSMVNSYQGHKFCPLVIYSSGVMPPELEEGPFLR